MVLERRPRGERGWTSRSRERRGVSHLAPLVGQAALAQPGGRRGGPPTLAPPAGVALAVLTCTNEARRGACARVEAGSARCARASRRATHALVFVALFGSAVRVCVWRCRALRREDRLAGCAHLRACGYWKRPPELDEDAALEDADVCCVLSRALFDFASYLRENMRDRVSLGAGCPMREWCGVLLSVPVSTARRTDPRSIQVTQTVRGIHRPSFRFLSPGERAQTEHGPSARPVCVTHAATAALRAAALSNAEELRLLMGGGERSRARLGLREARMRVTYHDRKHLPVTNAHTVFMV